MYYRLADHIALRSWKGVILAYYVRGQVNAKPVTVRQAKARLAHDVLNKIVDDDTGMGMGDLLLAEMKDEMGGEAWAKLSDEE